MKTKTPDGKKRTAKKHLGNLPPRYKFILNPYSDLRVSKCPICRGFTHKRKFPLLTHIDDWGLLVLGKTCRYCSLCELIVAHRDEFENELVTVFEHRAPHVIGNPYLVVGAVELKFWKESLDKKAENPLAMLDHAADFKQVLQLKAGWEQIPKPKRGS